MNLRKSVHTITSSTVGILYPKQCCLCQKELSLEEHYVCLPCSYDLPFIEHKSIEVKQAEKIFWGRIPIEGVYSLFNYQKGNQVQQLLHEIKYKRKLKMGQFYGQLLAEQISDSTIDLIIPLPLHPKKERKRGFNQSKIIAKGIADKLNLPINTKCVKRTAHTLSQTQMTKYDRWDNVRSIFELNQATTISNKHVLLVDDVLTTGATLESCAMSLLEGQNVKVSVATLAVRL